jgi:hypothetical protein
LKEGKKKTTPMRGVRASRKERAVVRAFYSFVHTLSRWLVVYEEEGP